MRGKDQMRLPFILRLSYHRGNGATLVQRSASPHHSLVLGRHSATSAGLPSGTLWTCSSRGTPQPSTKSFERTFVALVGANAFDTKVNVHLRHVKGVDRHATVEIPWIQWRPWLSLPPCWLKHRRSLRQTRYLSCFQRQIP
jgi:hypothetical protein